MAIKFAVAAFWRQWSPRLVSMALTGPGVCVGIGLVVVFLTKIFGDQCWLPRVGGILVGCAVFMQGYAFAHPEKFRRKLKSGLTLEQKLMHVVYVSSVIGTFAWALGDFVTSIWGVEMCRR